MKISNLKKGLIFASLGSFWWGIFGVLYFKHFSFIGHLELVLHRCIWTALMLFITTLLLSKFNLFINVFKKPKTLFILFITGILIFANWGIWLYAVATNKMIDASFGYFIMPILSVLFGAIFFKEVLNKKRLISIFLVIISIIYLLIKFNTIPWVGISVGLAWSIYNLLRKKINVGTDVGLLIESLFILPFAIVAFYLISINGFNDFKIEDPPMMLFIFLAGPMTVIPLFLYVRGVELCGLGPTGMIFYITPTLQFLLGFFYYDEVFSFNKLVSFIFIWIAVIVYLKDLHENN